MVKFSGPGQNRKIRHFDQLALKSQNRTFRCQPCWNQNFRERKLSTIQWGHNSNFRLDFYRPNSKYVTKQLCQSRIIFKVCVGAFWDRDVSHHQTRLIHHHGTQRLKTEVKRGFSFLFFLFLESFTIWVNCPVRSQIQIFARTSPDQTWNISQNSSIKAESGFVLRLEPGCEFTMELTESGN